MTVLLPGPQSWHVEIRDRIRLNLGCGGANFPGAAQLYAAAEEIERWMDADAKAKASFEKQAD